MVYLFGWAAIYFALFINGFSRYKGAFFCILVLCLLGGLAVLRGEVGTDTITYEQIVRSFRVGSGFDGLEPLFSAMIVVLSYVISNDRFVVRAFSVIFILLLLMYIGKAKKNELFFLLAFFFPSFFFQYSMNAIRLGLACVCFLIMVQYMARSMRFRASAFALIALGLHYSILFSILYVYFLNSRLGVLRISFWIVTSFFLFVLLFFLNHEYFSSKATLYSDYQSPSALSGLSNVLSIASILIGLLLCRLPHPVKYKFFTLSLLLLVLFYGLTFFTYAGIRLLNLLSLALPVLILLKYGESDLCFDRFIKIALVVAGAISMVAAYRGFIIYSGVGDAPFIPYRFLER